MSHSVLLGIGVSAISETPIVPSEREGGADLCAQIEAGDVSTLRGHVLTSEDMHARWQITTSAVFFPHRLRTKEPDRPIFSKVL